MHFLIPVSSILLIIIIAVVSGRTVSQLEVSDKNTSDSSKKIILLESPESAARLEEDKNLLQVKNFTLKNTLDEDWKNSGDHENRSSNSFNLVVPVARNFSSLKELFDILREDSRKPVAAPSMIANQSHVRGSEANSSDYVIFFTS